MSDSSSATVVTKPHNPVATGVYNSIMGFWKSVFTSLQVADATVQAAKPANIDKLWGYLDVREEEMLRMSYLCDYDRGRADAYGEIESYLRTLYAPPADL